MAASGATTTPTHESLFGAINGATVTPADNALVPGGFTRAIYVGGLGDLTVVMMNDVAVTLVAVSAGSFLPLCVKCVNSTGTTATNIVAFK